MNNAFPFPPRINGALDSDCFYVKPDANDYENQLKSYLNKISKEAISLKLQYFSIEEELVNSFQFVSPIPKNLNTSSVKFATVIREASNLFEQVSKLIYKKLFGEEMQINIFNYLSLDKFLDFNSYQFHCPILQNVAAENISLLKPFEELAVWDKNSPLLPDYIPKWWKAYNKIKHSPDELADYSTLEIAIEALTASHIIIARYLGSGVVSGDLSMPEMNGDKVLHRQLVVKKSELFMNTEELLGYVY